MSMNKKIIYLVLIFISLFIFSKNTYAISSSTKWNSSTEELEYSYEASVVGIRRIWLDCTGPSGTTTITLYSGDVTKQRITGSKSTNNLKNGQYVCKAHVETKNDNDDREFDGDVSFTKNNYDPSTDDSNSNGNGGSNGVGSSEKTDCESITVEENCTSGNACRWNTIKNKCEYAYIAENPCSEPEILQVLHFLGYLLLIAKIMIPLIIIGFGTFDLFKAVIDKDEKSITKQLKILGMRLLGGLFVFFLPTIIYAVFSLSTQLSTYQESKYQACADCLLKPTRGNCNTDN